MSKDPTFLYQFDQDLLYRINDVLGMLCSEYGVTLDDDTMNDLTHHIYEVISTTQPLVTCDGCDAHSQTGWGDTPLCLDCQRREDPHHICETHQRTFHDTCPLTH